MKARHVVRFIVTYLFLLSLAFLIPNQATAEEHDLSWVAPVEREDNSVLSPAEISHFNILNSVDGSLIVENILSTLTMYRHNFPTGTHKIVMTTVDTDGRESVFSPVITINAETSPKSVTGFKSARVLP